MQNLNNLKTCFLPPSLWTSICLAYMRWEKIHEAIITWIDIRSADVITFASLAKYQSLTWHPSIPLFHWFKNTICYFFSFFLNIFYGDSHMDFSSILWFYFYTFELGVILIYRSCQPLLNLLPYCHYMQIFVFNNIFASSLQFLAATWLSLAKWF